MNPPEYRRAYVVLAVLAIVLGTLAGAGDAPPMAAAGPDPTPTLAAPGVPTGDLNWSPSLRPLEPNYLVKAPLLHTDNSRQPRRELFTYRVISGDTIVGIAKRNDISPESILWANERTELNPEFLRIGQELLIPPTTGVLHTIAGNDTLESIAKRYKADVGSIVSLEFNGLTPPYTLVTGRRLMVPGGEKPYVPRVVYGYSGELPQNTPKGTGNFVWPVGGVLTQLFWTGHRGIDIGVRSGTSVVASDSGYVVLVANSDAGYGRHVMVNHGNGFESLYAHLNVILVAPGQTVRKGQAIGLSGSTGRSTGPHVHFEIRYFGQQRNPAYYLP